MNISMIQGNVLDVRCDLLVVNLFEGVERPGGATGAVDAAMGGALSDLIKRDGFQGKLGERLVFPTFGKLKARKVCVLGLGPRKTFNEDTIRIVGGHIIKASRDAKARKVATILHGAGIGGLDVRAAAQALGEGLRLGAYRFHAYRGTGTKDQADKKDIQDVVIVEAERSKMKDAIQGLDRAQVLSDAAMLARDLVNTPSRDMTPAHLADVARSLATRGSRIRCKVLDREQMEKLGMGAAPAVASGSAPPPVGVHLTYTPSRRPKRRVAVIGKAVTFDSGGLNIKPEKGMVTMKIDMAGAASVIGLFKVLPALNLPIEVHGIFLAVENMPSGTAYRPGDVVRAMNGMTIEILNTDAEGRVTLADALSYATKKIKPDIMVDLATLTGAAVVALGEEITALMTNDRRLGKDLLRAASITGEAMWQLPLYGTYDDALKSKIADVNNTGGRDASCIKGGLFLQRFVGATPWAHLDIAGPSYCEKETRPDVPHGGTGVGVRTLAAWLESIK